MPINYQDYSLNWFSHIRPQILKRANNSCEVCSVKNYSVYYGSPDTRQIISLPKLEHLQECRSYSESRTIAKKLNNIAGLKVWKVIVLTIAHLNHNTKDDREHNLKCLCQRCHLKHDLKHHLHSRKYK